MIVLYVPGSSFEMTFFRLSFVEIGGNVQGFYLIWGIFASLRKRWWTFCNSNISLSLFVESNDTH